MLPIRRCGGGKRDTVGGRAKVNAKVKPKVGSYTKIAQRTLRDNPATTLLGFRAVSVGRGRAVLKLVVQAKHRQLHGVVHGGILAALADTASAIAAYTAVAPGTAIATVELKINYLEAVPSGTVRAEARVLRAGRNFVVVECELIDRRGRLAAKALMTFGAAGGHAIGRDGYAKGATSAMGRTKKQTPG
jgi:uncharacterized protein (TIGR00369 family)